VRPLAADVPAFTAANRAHHAHHADRGDRVGRTDNDVSNEGIVTR
jgi:hypothetical protein